MLWMRRRHVNRLKIIVDTNLSLRLYLFPLTSFVYLPHEMLDIIGDTHSSTTTTTMASTTTTTRRKKNENYYFGRFERTYLVFICTFTVVYL